MEYILPVGILLVMFFGVIWTAYKDNKEFNGGACPNCENGNWRRSGVDSGGCTGYACDNCNAHFWESGWIDHTKK